MVSTIKIAREGKEVNLGHFSTISDAKGRSNTLTRCALRVGNPIMPDMKRLFLCV